MEATYSRPMTIAALLQVATQCVQYASKHVQYPCGDVHLTHGQQCDAVVVVLATTRVACEGRKVRNSVDLAIFLSATARPRRGRWPVCHFGTKLVYPAREHSQFRGETRRAHGAERLCQHAPAGSWAPRDGERRERLRGSRSARGENVVG